MATFDLTTLANVKQWLGIPDATTSSDTLLGQLITNASRWILSFLSRGNILQASYTDYYDGGGYGQNRILLKRWPVLSITSVMIGTSVISAGVRPTPTNQAATNGYLLDLWDGIAPGSPQFLDFYGYSLPRGRQNVAVTYSAGYGVVGYAAAVPATPYQVTPATPYGAWAADNGVTYATGTPLVKVASGPAVGQYAVSATGVYTFAAADLNAAVLISFSFIPADLAQAAIEMVSERFKAREHIGQNSKSLGGQETITFSTKDMSAAVATMLQNYKSVVPY